MKSEEAARTKELQLKNAELEAALKSAQEASLVLKNEAKDSKNLKEVVSHFCRTQNILIVFWHQYSDFLSAGKGEA